MNKAFRNVTTWYLGELGASEEDREDFIELIENGLKASEPETAAILISLLQKAEEMATDLGNEAVLELLEIGKELVVAESALDKAESLAAIRTIMDLPKDFPLINRIRAFKQLQHVEALKD